MQNLSKALVPYSPPPLPVIYASVGINPKPEIKAGPDLLQLLLDDKRSPQTRRAYESDLTQFFAASESSINSFVALSPPEIALALSTYKAKMRASGLSEATINRRLAAVRSLLKFAHRLGFACTDGRGLVDGEKVTGYRDTRGVDVKTLKKLLAQPGKLFGSTLRAARDEALLTLLIENALRRSEVCRLDECDFEASTRSLWILGKGRGTQREKITLSHLCVQRVCTYVQLKLRTRVSQESTHTPSEKFPLFCNLDRRPEYSGQRLTPDGLYQLIGFYGKAVGLSRLTPHQLRHSSITAALDATNGDVRRVQKLSRHSKLQTLQIYDDAREDFQGQVTGVLSGLLQR